MVPVIFSDSRLTNETLSFPTRQTYIDLQEITFAGIKSCLNDKNKVALSHEYGNDFFQATGDGLQLSTGLNIILGERSSGKTFTLDKICQENDNVKYIKDRLFQDSRYNTQNNKILKLGWKPSHTLKNSLPSLIKWYSGDDNFFKKQQ